MSRIFNITEHSKIYVVCPANNKTGGTELLHQLVYQLCQLGHHALIAYYPEGNCDRNNPTDEAFLPYIKNRCLIYDIEDKKENIVIFPEVCIGKHRRFKHIQKCVWWLSVDNYFASVGKLNRLKRYGVLSFLKHLALNDYPRRSDLPKIGVHLCQSHFALNFLLKNGIAPQCIHYLSDYINDIYLSDQSYAEKEDIVLYNPKKGLYVTRTLMEYAPDIRWVAIENMTNDEVLSLMRRAKVYIDFGNHPGKDRIPREAAVSGCCVITNRRGSAALHEDVPIDDRYKIDDHTPCAAEAVSMIRNCLQNYEQCTQDFIPYREMILLEKKRFCADVAAIFS